MNSQKEFNDKLNEMRKKSIIEVSQWWGLRNAGYSGTIITNDKDVYKYQYDELLSK